MLFAIFIVRITKQAITMSARFSAKEMDYEIK